MNEVKRFKLTDEQTYYLLENNLQVNLQKAQRMPCFIQCPPEQCNCGSYDGPDVLTDAEILERSIQALTRQFDAFIGACMDADGKPTAPTMKALMQARACLPPSATNSLSKEKP